MAIHLAIFPYFTRYVLFQFRTPYSQVVTTGVWFLYEAQLRIRAMHIGYLNIGLRLHIAMDIAYEI